MKKLKINLHTSRKVFFCLNFNLCDDLYGKLINSRKRQNVLHFSKSLSIVMTFVVIKLRSYYSKSYHKTS